MKNSELIAFLQTLPSDAEIVINQSSYPATCLAITESNCRIWYKTFTINEENVQNLNKVRVLVL